MNEALYMILVFVTGLVLGTIFFGGLWITVKKAVKAKVPALWIFSSFFLRIVITLAGFYFISSGNWKRLMICLMGFIVARFLVIHFTRSQDKRQLELNKEVEHES